MPINTACSSCGKSYVLDDAVLGKKVRCKQCGNPFVASTGDSKPAAQTKPAPAATKEVRNPSSDLYSGLASAAQAESNVKPKFDDDADIYDLKPAAADRGGGGGQAAPSQCPSCRSPLSAQQQICMNCGYDRRTGSRASMARPERNQPRNNRDQRDRNGFRAVKEFSNPGVQMIETILLKSASIFVAVGIFFLAVVLPIYLTTNYNRYLNNIEERMTAAGFNDGQKERERANHLSVPAYFGRLVVIGLAATVGIGCAYAGMMTGSRVGAMIRRCSFPDSEFARQNVTLMSAWVLFMLLVFFSASAGGGISNGGGDGFMGFASVFFGSFYLWIGWAGGAVVGLLGARNTGFPLQMAAGVLGLSIIGLIGSMVMFPVYWFIHRLRIIDALVSFAFMCVGYIVGSALGGVIMFGILHLMPAMPAPRGIGGFP